MNRFQNFLAVTIVVAAMVLIVTAQAQSPLGHSAELHRADTVTLKAKGLLPNAVFTVFLTGLEDSRFGAADYMGELPTNKEGRGTMHIEASGDRRDLNNAVLRLFNPVTGDVCFTPVSGPISVFDEFGSRHTASLATILTSDSRSAADASLFHTMNWRYVQCAFKF